MEKAFIDFMQQAEIEKALCICVRSNREVAHCSDPVICPYNRILVKVKSISSAGGVGGGGSVADISMLGGFGWKYIAMGMTNIEDEPSMAVIKLWSFYYWSNKAFRFLFMNSYYILTRFRVEIQHSCADSTSMIGITVRASFHLTLR